MMANKYYLKVRCHPGESLLDLLLCRQDGPAHAGLLYGKVTRKTADEIALATGLKVEEEACPEMPSPPVAKVPDLEGQQLLFGPLAEEEAPS
jgi:hypothetical protein